MKQFLRKLQWLIQRGRREAELRDELQFHLQEEIDQRGAAAARRELGNVTLLMEDARSAWGWVALEQCWQDLRFAVRTLRKSPGFACAAVLSLGLGIGANTAIFSLLDALVLRSLPVTDPRQLVQFAYTPPLWGVDNWNSRFGYPQLQRFRAESKTLSGIFGGAGLGRVNIGFRETSGVAQADAYTDNFFSVLGVRPQHGRFFSIGEDTPDASVAVLSDRYWHTRFAADPAIVGGVVSINRIPFTVIGVTPPEFSGTSAGSGPDLWVPLRTLYRLKHDREQWTEAFTNWLLIAGRLRPGVSPEQAQAELNVIHRRLLEQQLAVSELRSRKDVQRFVRENRLLLRPAATGTDSALRDRYAFSLKLLMGVALIVLLVACTNIANLLLARASKRRREFAVRLALGAGRGRVVRQLLTESIFLAALGGAMGLALARWGSVALVRMISTGDSVAPLDVHTNWRIFVFAAALSLLTGILFGLAPALRVREFDGPTRRYSHVLNRMLVVAQVALSVVLITGAALFVRSLQKLWSVDLGYDRENVLMFSVDVKLAGYPRERAGAVYRQILERLKGLPDVQSASASVVRPVDDQFYLVDRVEEIDGRRLPESNGIRVVWNAISPGYFSAVATPLQTGRDFEPRDDETAPPVAIVNESLARRAFPNQDPIGHRLAAATIVGVVKDSHYNGARDQPKPEVYYPMFQHGRDQEFRWGFVSFELRCRASSSVLDRLRHEVAAVDRNLPVFRVTTLEAQAERSLLKERLLAMLSTLFGALALILACVGLFGLTAYVVARRTAEIGIRVALGARRDHIVWLVLRETICLALSGVVAGIFLALWAARYVKSILFETSAADPLAIAAAIAIMIAFATLAGFIPALRALRVDPIAALRYE